MTYAEVANKAGNPRAVRAVGTILSKNYDPEIPCHRVIRSDGKIGNYNRGGTEKKREMLIKEKLWGLGENQRAPAHRKP